MSVVASLKDGRIIVEVALRCPFIAVAIIRIAEVLLSDTASPNLSRTSFDDA